MSRSRMTDEELNARMRRMTVAELRAEIAYWTLRAEHLGHKNARAVARRRVRLAERILAEREDPPLDDEP